ncbi:MAG: hypothetical protein FWD76_01000 [Firmicutes bacterium]|nr:hypothetical protein [Bacillota bacterium]
MFRREDWDRKDMLEQEDWKQKEILAQANWSQKKLGEDWKLGQLTAVEKKHMFLICFAVWMAGYVVFWGVAFLLYAKPGVVVGEMDLLNSNWAAVLLLSVFGGLCALLLLVSFCLTLLETAAKSKWSERVAKVGALILLLSILLLAGVVWFSARGGAKDEHRQKLDIGFWALGVVLVLLVPPVVYGLVQKWVRKVRVKKQNTK